MKSPPRPSSVSIVAAALALLAWIPLACQRAPGPEATARAYLAAWERQDYPAMYALLSAGARARIDVAAFAARYRVVEEAAGRLQLRAALGERADPGGDQLARYPITVRWDTAPFGIVAQRVGMTLVHEPAGWRVDWTPALILGELAEGDTVRRVALPAPRGGMVDRHGATLVPTAAERAYPRGALAAHVIGYVEQTEDGEVRGVAGLERWADADLRGVPGERLVVVGPDGRERARVAERPPQPGAVLELTLDAALQAAAEAALDGHTGAVVALDPRDSRVLALASRPTFDPAEPLADGSAPPAAQALNRAVAEAYTVASLFKVVAMGAALESGDYDPTTPFRCPGFWRPPGGARALEDSLPGGHGRLTLHEGLARSCNVVFYEIARHLDALDPHLLPAVARAYGLGAPTGLVGLAEAAGHVPDPRTVEAQGPPWTVYDAAELAVGHGGLRATPLQLARLFAALATDGVLRQPVLVRRVVEMDGRERRSYSSEAQGTLPLSEAHRRAIQDAMRDVVADPRGTAAAAFRGFAVPTAGKTGSAERDGPLLDALYAGYAPADAPEIVVVGVVERGGSGGLVAAPLVRRVLEAHLAAR